MSVRIPFRGDDEGAVLIEFTLIMALLFLLTFSIVEFAILANTFNSAQKATQAGARVASSRLILEGAEDCGPNTNGSRAGTDCTDVAGSTGWSVECTGSGGNGCNAAGLAALVAEVQSLFPDAEAADIVVRFQGTGLGFVGKGNPVPAVTVEIRNITYDFIVVDDLVNAMTGSNDFAGSINLSSAKTTIVAEDLREGGA